MDAAALRQLWHENNDRPAFVREHRDAIHEYTATSEEIPDKSLFEVRQWLTKYKATVSRQLNDAVDDEEKENETQVTDTTADSESEAEA